MNTGLQIIESLNCIEEVIEDKEIQVPRSLWERFFDSDPTRPLWQKTRAEIIQVSMRKPAMYRVMDKLIVHPALMPSLLDAIEKRNRNGIPSSYHW